MKNDVSKFRKVSKLTQEELAKMVGVTRQTIISIEQGKYIASFLGFAPADNPQVVAVAIVNHPKGNYYGGAVAAPIIRQLFENILPYLEGIDYNQ